MWNVNIHMETELRVDRVTEKYYRESKADKFYNLK